MEDKGGEMVWDGGEMVVRLWWGGVQKGGKKVVWWWKGGEKGMKSFLKIFIIMWMSFLNDNFRIMICYQFWFVKLTDPEIPVRSSGYG